MEKSKLEHFKKYKALLVKERNQKPHNSKRLNTYKDLDGWGFFNSVKNKITDLLSYRKAFSNADALTYSQNKDKKIVKLVVVRTPLSWASKKFADISSINTFDQQAKQLGYDKVFHLYMLIYLEGIEQPILYEKNETVVLRFGSPSTEQFTQMKDVNLNGREITLGEFIETSKTQMGPEEYFHYTFDKQNCQRFINLNLKSNGLLTNELQNFIMQNAGKLLSKAPKLSLKLAQGISNVAALGRKITGLGL